MSVNLTLNGRAQRVEAPAEMPLLWALRDRLGATGTKFGCGQALCGACTCHLDGQAIRSCVTPLSAVQGKRVITIEGIGASRVGRAVQSSWVALDVAQCGYCQPGQIMSATALLQSNPRPSDAEIDAAMAGNICRCGTYTRIRAAIRRASDLLTG
jgi:isoquinoline 1-oxidoreductase subunit alpha